LPAFPTKKFCLEILATLKKGRLNHFIKLVFKRRFKRGGFARKMIKGSWICSDCGKEITELPFNPSPERPVYCKECWAKRRQR